VALGALVAARLGLAAHDLGLVQVAALAPVGSRACQVLVLVVLLVGVAPPAVVVVPAVVDPRSAGVVVVAVPTNCSPWTSRPTHRLTRRFPMASW
jgi:hypothetical protein